MSGPLRPDLPASEPGQLASTLPTVSRRAVLAGAGALTATALLPVDGGWLRALAAVTGPLERRLADRLVGLLPDPAALHALGRRYLATAAEVDVPSLVRALGAGAPGGTAALVTAPARALRDHLAGARTRELDRGEVVVLDGWVTAPTEARLAALAVIVDSLPRD